MVLQAPFSNRRFNRSKVRSGIVNDKALQLWRRERDEVMGKPILEAMPELQDQGIKELLDEVYNTGKTFSATEMPVKILNNGKLEETFINFNYQAFLIQKGHGWNIGNQAST